MRELVESREGFTFLSTGMYMLCMHYSLIYFFLQRELNVRLMSTRPIICWYNSLCVDFKSIELRVLAHLSSDPQLLSAFNSHTSTDIFVTLASEWYMTPDTLSTPYGGMVYAPTAAWPVGCVYGTCMGLIPGTLMGYWLCMAVTIGWGWNQLK